MAVFMLCIGTLWGKSVIGRQDDPARHKRLSRSSSPPASPRSAARCCSRTRSCASRVLSYEGIAQLVPAVVGGLLWRRMTVQGALAGLIVGEAIVVPLALGGHDPFLGINAGLLGLVANVIVNVAVSRARPEADAPGQRFQRSPGSLTPSSSQV